MVRMKQKVTRVIAMITHVNGNKRGRKIMPVMANIRKREKKIIPMATKMIKRERKIMPMTCEEKRVIAYASDKERGKRSCQ